MDGNSKDLPGTLKFNRNLWSSCSKAVGMESVEPRAQFLQIARLSRLELGSLLGNKDSSFIKRWLPT